MALTVTRVGSGVESMGSLRASIVDLAFDDSYPTGGEALTPATLGLSDVVFALVEPAAGYSFEYDHANDKVIARYADYNAAGDGALIQVPDTTDLSAVTGARMIAWGHGV